MGNEIFFTIFLITTNFSSKIKMPFSAAFYIIQNYQEKANDKVARNYGLTSHANGYPKYSIGIVQSSPGLFSVTSTYQTIKQGI